MNMDTDQLWLIKECLHEREQVDKVSSKVQKMVTVFSKCSPEEQMMFLQEIKAWPSAYVEQDHPIKGDGDLDLMEHFDGHQQTNQ